MKSFKSYKNVMIATIFSFFCISRRAHAYIDPGTGSYMIQLMIGGLIGAAFVLKSYWRNVKSFLTNLFSKHKKK